MVQVDKDTVRQGEFKGWWAPRQASKTHVAKDNPRHIDQAADVEILVEEMVFVLNESKFKSKSSQAVPLSITI